jgi:hypothetical protein
MHQMRLPKTAHTSPPWRVHEFTGDFELEDVWEVPTPGGRDDLARLVELSVSVSDGYEYPAVFRALFALHWKLGKLFGWDEPDVGLGKRVPSLRERLPADLLEGLAVPICTRFPGGWRRTARRSSSRSTRRVTSGSPSTPARPCIP